MIMDNTHEMVDVLLVASALVVQLAAASVYHVFVLNRFHVRGSSLLTLALWLMAARRAVALTAEFGTTWPILAHVNSALPLAISLLIAVAALLISQDLHRRHLEGEQQ